MNGMMTGARLDGIEGWEQTFDNSACSLSLGSFDLGGWMALKVGNKPMAILKLAFTG